MPATPRRPIVADRVETWVFDLDNTLYPVGPDMHAQIDELLGSFVAGFLSVDRAEARRIQKDYFGRYGLTLRGLMLHHGLEPQVYAAHMMQTDLSGIAPDPVLADRIARLPGRKIVHSNAFAAHVETVLGMLGLTDHFEAVHDIEAAGYVPKPVDDAYRELCRRHRIDAGRAVMIDDIARNLEPAARMGMTTVWKKTDAAWAREAGIEEHIHHVTEDVAGWLGELLGAPGDESRA